ncbi:hypothetical protein ANME2D_00637 [Candidatus Methanoperedens nitroreducens]|uniref:Uncharacterized protein n=2 Tax=Candidatus Methanoperedens nitratireducens TaxID=1392998 RepID=A0A062V3B3_9EURY|nr:hypothetical protein ANME2D_00637 [Candidatus Methanoperedens nitroreducens]
MNNIIIKPGKGMTNIKFIPIIFIITLSAFFLGCVESPDGTPTATPSPTATIEPTITPTYTPTPAPTPEPVPEAAVTYIVWIDSDRGFYKARAIEDTTYLELPADFNILNFTINVGDKVRWVNDDIYDFPVTVASNEDLWTNRTGYLRWREDKFEYIFNNTGIYTFYIQEYPRRPQQKITVR